MKLCSKFLIGTLLHKKLSSASAEAAKQTKVFEDFTASLKAENVKQWTDEIEAFEQGLTTQDPYENAKTGWFL